MKITYQARLDKATRELFNDNWRGRVCDVNIQHDSWCAIYAGDGCNCDPDITMFTPIGIYTVDRQGNASLVDKPLNVGADWQKWKKEKTA